MRHFGEPTVVGRLGSSGVLGRWDLECLRVVRGCAAESLPPLPIEGLVDHRQHGLHFQLVIEEVGQTNKLIVWA